MDEGLNIGKEIKRRLKKQGKSVAWLAEQIGCDPRNLRKRLACKRFKIDAKQLFDISAATGFDFFMFYSQRLNPLIDLLSTQTGNAIPNIHIGQHIKRQVKKRGLTVTAFADSINRSRNAVYHLFIKEHIATDVLVLISNVLGYNFFKLYISDDGEKDK